MLTKTIENILTILALTVFADKRVFSNEIDSFVNSARTVSYTHLTLPTKA